MGLGVGVGAGATVHKQPLTGRGGGWGAAQGSEETPAVERKETGPSLGLGQWGLPRSRETPPPPNLLNWKLLTAI